MITCPQIPTDQRGPLSQWFAHRLRNAMTPVTIRAELCRDSVLASLPASPGELVRLVESVAYANAVIEEIIAEIRNAN